MCRAIAACLRRTTRLRLLRCRLRPRGGALLAGPCAALHHGLQPHMEGAAVCHELLLGPLAPLQHGGGRAGGTWATQAKRGVQGSKGPTDPSVTPDLAAPRDNPTREPLRCLAWATASTQHHLSDLHRTALRPLPSLSGGAPRPHLHPVDSGCELHGLAVQVGPLGDDAPRRLQLGLLGQRVVAQVDGLGLGGRGGRAHAAGGNKACPARSAV